MRSISSVTATAFGIVVIFVLSHVSGSSSVSSSIFDSGRNDSIDIKDFIGEMVNQLTNRLKCDSYGLKKEDCELCLKTDRIIDLLKIPSDRNYVTEVDVLDISTVLLHHILYFPTLCTLKPPGCRDYLVCRDELLQLLQRPEGAMYSLQYIFRELKHVLEPGPAQECFSAKSILVESRNFSSSIQEVHDKTVVNIMRHIFSGHCIDASESVSDFLDDIFHSYGTACSSLVNIDGLKHIIEDLHKGKNNHNHVHDHSNHDHGSGKNHDHDNEKDHNGHDHENEFLECEKMRKLYMDLPHPHHTYEHLTPFHDIHEHGGMHDNYNHGSLDRNVLSERFVEHQTDPNLRSSTDIYEHNKPANSSYYPEHINENMTETSNFHHHSQVNNQSFISTTTIEPETNSEALKLLISNDTVSLSSDSKHLSYKDSEENYSTAITEISENSSTDNSNAVHGVTSIASALRSEFFHQDDNSQRQNSIPFSVNNDQKLLYRNSDEQNSVESRENYSFMDHPPSLAQKCLSVEELLESFGHSASGTITRFEFYEICPALVQQKISGVCNKHIEKKRDVPTTWELYGYSTLAVLIISLTSLAGVVLLPILAKQIYYYIMAGCIGLAFSTLAGDALLHLIPQVLGTHSHGDDDSHDHEGGLDPALLKQLSIFLAIYFLYLFQACVCTFSKNKNSPGAGGHGHSHLPEALPKELTLVSVKVKSDSSVTLASPPGQSTTSLDTEIAENETPHEKKQNLLSAPTLCGLSTVALLITLGDSIHNFSDGLAIGAAFSSGVRSGVSTTIAVFCHELPHEFGDFVVLLSTGLSFSKALWLNFLSGLTCFIGLYIGIQLGVDEGARTWIMGVTAGIFLYVAMTEMLPDLKEGNKGDPVKMLIVKNVGILGGLAIMVIISVYEHSFYF